METEIWPNLFRQCREFNVPLVTVNGRLSRRTLQTAGWIKALYRSTLTYSSLILARSDNDAKNYIALGADPQKVKTIGNIKFSVQFNLPESSSHPFNSRSYVLAASTHDNEEQQMAQFWTRRVGELKDHLLVIAPRHPKRIGKIREQLAAVPLNVAIRSRSDTVEQNTHIYIVDTLGELVHFMNHAEVIFMGGSLVPTGGHNILEPAFLSKAIVFGPHMQNFADEAKLFVDHDAAIQADNINEVGENILALLNDDARRRQLGGNARALLDRHKDAADRYVAEIHSLLKKNGQNPKS